MGRMYGWDLGGANVKLARAENGRIASVAQVPCPRIADPEKFNEAVDAALVLCRPGGRHAVTMTGELSDVFPSRAAGVAYLTNLMRKKSGEDTLFYSLTEGLIGASRVRGAWQDVASANWHASAAFAATREANGLLVDIGTTTTDLIPLKDGTPRAIGKTDGERMTEGELIYAGVVRTPVMAVAQEAPFKGRLQGIAGERFATMADVYRLTGELPKDADPYDTADGRGKSRDESAARLARMLGRDADEAAFIAWKALAHFLGRRQLDHIAADAQVLIEREALTPEAPIIGAGCGRFLAVQLAARLQRSYRDFAELIDCDDDDRDMAATCAPAVALALLAEEAQSAP
jgi:(4-(4-[2-(gamma-L-glutamylamino)ethyl]phenoxymethyl)furan-2-yl)methanamine synthase